MLGVSRNIPSAHDTMRCGKWAKNSFNGRTLNGKTLGIIGFGSVGQAVSTLTLRVHIGATTYYHISAGVDIRLQGWEYVAALLAGLFCASTLVDPCGCHGSPRYLHTMHKCACTAISEHGVGGMSHNALSLWYTPCITMDMKCISTNPQPSPTITTAGKACGGFRDGGGDSRRSQTAPCLW